MPKKVHDWQGFAKKLKSAPHRWHCLPNVRRTVAGGIRRGVVRPINLLGGSVQVKQVHSHLDDEGVERSDVWVKWTPEGDEVLNSAPPPLRNDKPKTRKPKRGEGVNEMHPFKVSARVFDDLEKITAQATVSKGFYLGQIVKDFLANGSTIDLRPPVSVNASVTEEIWSKAERKALDEYGVSLRTILKYELQERLKDES